MKQDFHSLYAHGFVRLAAATPAARVGDPAANAAAILELARRGRRGEGGDRASSPSSASRPTRSTTCCTRTRCWARSRPGSRGWPRPRATLFPVLIVGAPLRHRGAALQHRRGDPSRPRCWASCPKAYLPNYREFYEKRHFTPGAGVRGETIAAGRRARSRSASTCCSRVEPATSTSTFHVEICEDIWTPIPPSSHAALAGAEVLINLSASNITIGKADVRRAALRQRSRRAASPPTSTPPPGLGESTTDLAWDGQAEVFENGVLLAASERFVARRS